MSCPYATPLLLFKVINELAEAHNFKKVFWYYFSAVTLLDFTKRCSGKQGPVQVSENSTLEFLYVSGGKRDPFPSCQKSA